MHGGIGRDLAPVGGVGADDGDPDVRGAFDPFVVLDPVGGCDPPAVVGGHDESGPAAVAVEGLHGLPERLQIGVEDIDVVEQAVVAARVRPVVRLPEGDVEQARALRFQIFDGQVEGHGVAATLLPERHDLELQIAEPGHARRRHVGRHPLVTGVGEERPLLAGRERREALPGSDGGDLPPAEPELAADELEDGRMGIAFHVVAHDVGLILPRQDLHVARGGEQERVLRVDAAALPLVPENDPLRCECSPEIRQERGAAFFGRVAPEPLSRPFEVVDPRTLFFLRDDRIHAGEQLLNTQPVDGDQDDIACAERPRDAGRYRARGGSGSGRLDAAGDRQDECGRRGQPRRHPAGGQRACSHPAAACRARRWAPRRRADDLGVVLCRRSASVRSMRARPASR